jgi:hypothetical protein
MFQYKNRFFIYISILFSICFLSTTCTLDKRLKEVETHPSWRDIQALAVAGDHIYAANTIDGLFILNVSNPLEPTMVDFGSTLESAHHIATANKFIYLVNDGLHLIDISTATDPKIVSIYQSKTPELDVSATVNYAYLATGKGGLDIIDLSDPAQPEKIAGYQPGDSVWDSAVVDTIAYLITTTASGIYIIEIVDVSNPINPTKVSDIQLNLANEITVVNNYAYVTTPYGMTILDVSHPQAPKVLESYKTRDYARGVKVYGDYAYINTTFGIDVVDVSDPHKPTKVGSYKLDQITDIDVVNGYIYVASYTEGITILELPQ